MMLLRVVGQTLSPGLIFADASEKEDKTQFEPTFGEPRELGDGFP